MPEAIGTATVTVTPEFTKDFEEMIRAIVRDEIAKATRPMVITINNAV